MPNSLMVSHGLKEEERRMFPRIPINMPVRLVAGAKRVHATALDISPKGLLLQTRGTHCRKGDQVSIAPDIELPRKDITLNGEIRWRKSRGESCFNGVFIENSEDLLHLLFLVSKNKIGTSFVDALLDALGESAFLIDSQMRIVSLSTRQPLVSVERDKVRGKRLTEVPTIFKLMPQEELNLKQDIQEVLYSRKDKQHKAVLLEYNSDGNKETCVFNVCYKYISSPPIDEGILIQVRDVTALYKLKDKIEKKNKNLFEQYRFTLMGHIVDELLEDIISPLSAVVGRIDLLKMKMVHQRGLSCGDADVNDWLRELGIIDGLVDQITQYCTVAAKRREREKLCAFKDTVSLNDLVGETLQILSVHEKFRRIEMDLDLAGDLPSFNGEYFDWLNALIALLQVLAKEMQSQNQRRIKISTRKEEGQLVLSVAHNAKALKMPLERETGLSIFDFIQKKYDVAIEAVGGNGRQKISFYIDTVNDLA